MYFVIAVATIVILRRNLAAAWVEWLVPLGIAIAFLPSGLRPDVLAVALTMSGFAVMELGGGSTWRQFAGWLLMFLGGSCAPRVTIFAGTLVLCAWQELRSKLGASRSPFLKLYALPIIALLVAVSVFLGMIHFRLAEFARTFHFHFTRFNATGRAPLKDFITATLGIFQWPLVGIPIALVIYSIGKPKDRLSVTALFIAAAFPLVALTNGGGVGIMWWFSLIMFLLAGSASVSKSNLLRRSLPFVTSLALLVGNRKLAVNCFGLLSGAISRDKGPQSQVALALRPTGEHPLLIDCEAGRYIFDYRLPEGSLDLEFGTPFPGNVPGDLSTEELRPGDIFLAGAWMVSILHDITYLNQATPKWLAFGSAKFEYERNPCRVYIIPAESCKAHRPGTGTMKKS